VRDYSFNQFSGRRPEPHELFWKKVRQKTKKSRVRAILIKVFAPLFSKSGWGFGGNAPEN